LPVLIHLESCAEGLPNSLASASFPFSVWHDVPSKFSTFENSIGPFEDVDEIICVLDEPLKDVDELICVLEELLDRLERILLNIELVPPAC
jgi:hypothetical protein